MFLSSEKSNDYQEETYMCQWNMWKYSQWKAYFIFYSEKCYINIEEIWKYITVGWSCEWRNKLAEISKEEREAWSYQWQWKYQNIQFTIRSNLTIAK